jgi:hypothetical protein
MSECITPIIYFSTGVVKHFLFFLFFYNKFKNVNFINIIVSQ